MSEEKDNSTHGLDRIREANAYLQDAVRIFMSALEAAKELPANSVRFKEIVSLSNDLSLGISEIQRTVASLNVVLHHICHDQLISEICGGYSGAKKLSVVK